MKISLCAIVRNEEDILERSLESIKDLVDEIIIVDTGSTDNTLEIAKKFTDKIYHFEWIDDFSAARNFCSGFATHPFILRWDADFVLQRDSLKKALEYKKSNFKDSDLIYFTFNTEFNEAKQPLIFTPNFFIYRKELFHWESPIHNKLVPNSDDSKINITNFMDIEVDHFKDVITKSHRYKQTRSLVEENLVKDPNNSYLLFLYAEGLMFDKDYFKAINIFNKYLDLTKENNSEKLSIVIENLALCYLKTNSLNTAKELIDIYTSALSTNPRFLLSKADIEVLTDKKSAKKIYLSFIKNKHNITQNYSYNYERFEVHPYIMLGTIELFEKNNKKALEYFDHALKNTKVLHTKNKLLTLIKSNSYFKI